MNIDELIKVELKSGNKEKLDLLRLIKAEFLKLQTAKTRATHDELSEAEKLSVLLKMRDARIEAAKEYHQYNRPELAAKEESELEMLKEYIPEIPSEEELVKKLPELFEEYKKEQGRELEMRDMKSIQGLCKVRYPGIDGKLVSREFNNFIKK